MVVKVWLDGSCCVFVGCVWLGLGDGFRMGYLLSMRRWVLVGGICWDFVGCISFGVRGVYSVLINRRVFVVSIS